MASRSDDPLMPETRLPVPLGGEHAVEGRRSREEIDRYIAEERAGWDERDAMIERCHEEASGSRRRATGEDAGAPDVAMIPPDAPSSSAAGEVRAVGRRTPPPAGLLRAPTPEEQEWVRRMSAFRTRVPKGLFRYASAEEANADWDRWRAALLAGGGGLDRTDDGG